MLYISIGAYGVKRGTAFYGDFGLRSVQRKKEPVGFWVFVVLQVSVGIWAILYGFGFFR